MLGEGSIKEDEHVYIYKKFMIIRLNTLRRLFNPKLICRVSLATLVVRDGIASVSHGPCALNLDLQLFGFV